MADITYLKRFIVYVYDTIFELLSNNHLTIDLGIGKVKKFIVGPCYKSKKPISLRCYPKCMISICTSLVNKQMNLKNAYIIVSFSTHMEGINGCLVGTPGLKPLKKTFFSYNTCKINLKEI